MPSDNPDPVRRQLELAELKAKIENLEVQTSAALKDQKNAKWVAFGAIIAALTSLVATFVNYQLGLSHAEYESAQHDIAEAHSGIEIADQIVKDNTAQRQASDSIREYTFKVYEKVFLALDTTDHRKRDIITSLTKTIVDPTIRFELLDVLSKDPGQPPELKAQAQAAHDEADQQKKIGGLWTYGVRWCLHERNDASFANDVFNALQSAQPFKTVERIPISAKEESDPTRNGRVLFNNLQVRFVDGYAAQATVVANYLNSKLNSKDLKFEPTEVEPKSENLRYNYIVVGICRH